MNVFRKSRLCWRVFSVSKGYIIRSTVSAAAAPAYCWLAARDEIFGIAVSRETHQHDVDV